VAENTQAEEKKEEEGVDPAKEKLEQERKRIQAHNEKLK
jgi:hypothetical protein